jgi:predicted ribosome quality control (RQC) complex YloA/Tae2 family protein
VAGVRIFRSRADETILVGKTARDNHYLTFRVGGPEDFWLHAQGVTGAHVLIRNPDRRRHPDEQSLLDAAVLAAWFSDARSQPRVDVQWTRRKYVRKARGGPPGAVVLKRFATIRVVPEEPAGEARGEGGRADRAPRREGDRR